MFNKIWFRKHQKILLRFINTPIGKWFFRIQNKEKILRIDPNAIYWKKGRRIVAEFRTHDKYAKRLYYGLKPLWHLIHTWDMVFANNFKPNWNLGFDTLTVNPVAGANSPVDGLVRREVAAAGETFGNIRTGSGTHASVTDTDTYLARLGASGTSNQYNHMLRSIFTFDTSPLSSDAVISSAVLSLWGTGGDIGLGTTTFDIVAATPAATNDLATSDYAQLGTTVFADDGGSFGVGAYEDFTLNASGISNIAKTGISKFGGRLGWDTDNSFGGVWSSTAETYFLGKYADETGTANDPKLVVTFSFPGGVESNYSFFM